MTFFHGIQVNEPVDGVRPILEKSTAVIGLVATATPGADAGAGAALDAAFPLNRAVLITDVRGAISRAGAGGTLAKSLGAIADQGSPLVVVVRVATGVAGAGVTELEATEANIIGSTDGSTYTGLQALLAAEAQLGVRPRIIGVPGLDSQAVLEAALVVAKRLRAFVYAACRTGAALCADRDTAVLYRGEFGDRELMLIWPEMTGWNGQAVATALGLRAMIDERIGWHRSLSNIELAGVTGLSKDVHFDIRDASTDAGVLNAAPVTTIVRMNGYRFWGNRTTSDEPYFAFEPATRTAHALQDVIADIEAKYMDRPMTIGLVRDMVEDGNAVLRRYAREGRIVGGSMYFDGSLNPAERLSAGKLTIDYDYTADAPMEGLTLNQRVTSKYYSGFGDALNGGVAA
jgi:hypothetical protein